MYRKPQKLDSLLQMLLFSSGKTFSPFFGKIFLVSNEICFSRKLKEIRQVVSSWLLQLTKKITRVIKSIKLLGEACSCVRHTQTTSLIFFLSVCILYIQQFIMFSISFLSLFDLKIIIYCLNTEERRGKKRWKIQKNLKFI